MMAQFLLWSFIWLGLFFLTRLFLIGVRWQDQAQFFAAHPEIEWLVSGYKLFLILWLPLSVVGTAHIFQNAPATSFYLFVTFVPLLGLGLVKSIPEITLGIGWFYGYRMPDKLTIKLKIPYFHHSLRFLQIYDFHFAAATHRVRLLGFVRLVANTAVLITLLIIY